MARFLGSVTGNRGGVTRLGSPQSGLTVRANGWRSGVRVEAEVENGKDVFRIYATGGSNNGSSKLIGSLSLVEGSPEPVWRLEA